MIDHFEVLAALRAHLKSLSVATTGVTALGASAQGFARTAGSFVDDGFTVGMEVTPSGFADNNVGIVTGVQPLLLSVEGGRTVEAEAGGRSLTVGLPEMRAWENMDFDPTDGRWYIEEDYLPGTPARATLGKSSFEMDHQPAYVMRLYGIAGRGVAALYKVSGAILQLFAPNLELTTSDGTVVRVRSDPAPNRGQVLPEGASHALVVITVPLWARTMNTI